MALDILFTVLILFWVLIIIVVVMNILLVVLILEQLILAVGIASLLLKEVSRASNLIMVLFVDRLQPSKAFIVMLLVLEVGAHEVGVRCFSSESWTQELLSLDVSGA